MFETAVDNGAEEFWFEEEITEPGAVNGDVGALHLLLAGGHGTVYGGLRLLVFFVVQQLVVNIVFGHDYSCGNNQEEET